MENILADDSMLELQVDASSCESLENGSWWARFIGIVSIILLFVVICLLIFALNTPALETLEYRLNYSGLAAIIWGVIAVCMLIFGALVTFLLNFAAKTNRAVKEMNQDMLESGISSLKIYFIILGVIAILTLVITIIGFFNK